MHTCTHAYMHTCTRTHAYMHTCIHACMHVCMYRMHAYMHIYMYACMHVCMHACVHVCMCACVCAALAAAATDDLLICLSAPALAPSAMTVTAGSAAAIAASLAAAAVVFVVGYAPAAFMPLAIEIPAVHFVPREHRSRLHLPRCARSPLRRWRRRSRAVQPCLRLAGS